METSLTAMSLAVMTTSKKSEVRPVYCTGGILWRDAQHHHGVTTQRAGQPGTEGNGNDGS